jgi:hypothetical protein
MLLFPVDAPTGRFSQERTLGFFLTSTALDLLPGGLQAGKSRSAWANAG